MNERTDDASQLLEAYEAGPAFASSTSVLASIRGRRHWARAHGGVIARRLERLGVAPHLVESAFAAARRHGTTPAFELIANRQLNEDQYYRQIAADIGLEFVAAIDERLVISDAALPEYRPGRAARLLVRDASGVLIICLAPDMQGEAALRSMLDGDKSLRRRFRIVSPESIRIVIEHRQRQEAVRNACDLLSDKMPGMSARDTLVPWQGFVLGLLAAIIPFFLWLWPDRFVQTVQWFAVIVFLLAISLRLAAFAHLKWQTLPQVPPPHAPPAPFPAAYPRYSVLVALHDEAPVVPQLVRSMSRLDWPASRLEVLYVCESDDAPTLAALGKMNLPQWQRVVEVPACQPRTKPKALNYALQQATGELLVIYDAEDRPHLGQLKEAWQRFSTADDRLACLQAPLDIANADRNWLTGMFALEYAAQFHGLLPYLSSMASPLPLGGTSNHFRKNVLVEAGGWDPYNVTEDADLGIRLARMGYVCATLSLPTLEDAPHCLSQWVPQRRRWQKGWYQTYLVHGRNIAELKIAIGLRNFLYFQILMASMIASPALYVISIFMILFSVYQRISEGSVDYLGGMQIIIFIFGHFAYAALAGQCWRKRGLPTSALLLASMPAYWTLSSITAWQAMWKLARQPHHWEKTAHEPMFVRSHESGALARGRSLAE